ncbi:ribosomal protection-like ABC-F family protein [Phototrophicus methaneseepsis]|nr:ABC-F family ATP-binding cassette domain-containing protein [Phototrophicus methaneseepsis]
MSLLTANKLSKVFGADEIFNDVTVEVPPGARVALVGPNGAGKTTLVNILIGQDSPTEGSVHKAKDARIAFLPQRPELAGNHSIWEEQLKAFAELRKMEAELLELTQQMAEPDTHDDAMAKYGPLEERFDHMGGYTYETRIKMVLTGVGFGEEDYNTPLTRLSGGQKTRAMLARLLLESPDLLVMDEPTNHLDIAAVEWLENYLRGYDGAVLAISHDRYFIDHYANVVWEMEFGTVETYRGNYTHYLQQREERRERLLKEYEAQQAFIAKEQEYIRKHMGSRWTAQAKGRQKKLETMAKRGKIIERGPQNRKQMRLKMAATNRSGDKVVMTRHLEVGYENVLFHVPDLTVYRGETVAIIGPNGAGKSTLLKTITGDIPALAGKVKLGAQVKIGYFAQAHEGLDPHHTLYDEIYALKPMTEVELRSYLGQYMFSGDDVYRPIETLSGGERGRLALAKLSLTGANLLLLDEPTNHLDIDSQEILQDVLEAYTGTILLVSHDRYLIDALATQIWSVSAGQFDAFEGTYGEYVTARNLGMSQVQQDTTASNGNGKGRKQAAQYAQKKHGLTPYELEKKLAQIEAHITKLETHMDSLTEQIAQASAAGDTERVHTLGTEYTDTEANLEATMAEWEKLAE